MIIDLEEKELFTNEDVSYIKSLYNDMDFKRSTISKDNESYIYSDVRTSESLVVDFNMDTKKIIFNRLQEFGIKELPEFFNILRYTKGQEFKLHTDTGENYRERYKTVIIQLSDELEYEGGNLNIYNQNKKYTASKKIGNTIIFSSQLEHQAEPIEKGTRICAVVWLEKKHFGFNNTLI